ncbi:hypothetical protein DFH06DRAFT_1351843 [Mycena polygramma]|nr:hypothetical protein DFH06DRAFT_1351843 [Mycena polygramma]
MADVFRAYLEEQVDETSIDSRVKWISGKKMLDPKDLVDRGWSTIDVRPRFGLEPVMSTRVENTIYDMQNLLRRASDLVPGRVSCFTIDPHYALMPILRNADSLDEIHIAWTALNKRMALAHRYLEKYDAQFRAEDKDLAPNSPASTDQGIYDKFPSSKNNMAQMSYLFDNVPHMSESLPSDYDKDVDTGQLSKIFGPSKLLQEAFPPRQAEERPSVVYYSANNQRMQKEGDFPSVERKGKERESPSNSGRKSSSEPKTVSFAVIEEDEEDQEELSQDESPQYKSISTAQYWGLGGSGSQISMSSGTSFKTAEEAMYPPARSRFDAQKGVPGPDLPEPLIKVWRDEGKGYVRPGGHLQREGTLPLEPPLTDNETSLHICLREPLPAPLALERKGSRELHRQEGIVAKKPSRELQLLRLRQQKDIVMLEPSRELQFLQLRRQEDTVMREPPHKPLRPEVEGTRMAVVAIVRATMIVAVDRQESQVRHAALGIVEITVTVRPRILLQIRRTLRLQVRRVLVAEEGAEEEAVGVEAAAEVAETMGAMGTEALGSHTLPQWDGAHDTAVDYFWDVGELAALDGWMPEALGYWLPSRLKKGSAVHSWFTTLPLARKKEMRTHYLVYLKVIKEKYLTKRWQLRMNVEFEQQAFRQPGHTRESPQQFIGRRAKFVRMLANADDGGPKEVFLILLRAPISWSTIMVVENIRSYEDLYEKVNDHEAALVEAVTHDSGDSITVHNLASTLRKLGFSQGGSQHVARRANLTVAEAEAEEPEELPVAAPDASEATPAVEDEQGVETMRQVYNTFKKRQRPPPKGGYKFARNDHVTTKMGRAPPSPCKVCGSPNHWDKECPDWEVYLEKVKRGVLRSELSRGDEEMEMMYHSAYYVLMEDRVRQSL